MDFFSVINVALPVIYVLVGIVLGWFVIELVMTVRKTRETVTSVQKQLEPTLEHVEKITASLEPVCDKIDPLVDRVSLTVDAANLEVMRLDQILEDVGEITSSASSAVNAVDTVANAPLELVNSVTKKVRRKFTPKKASDESVALGQGAPDEPNPVSDFVDATADAATAAVAAGKGRVAGKASNEEVSASAVAATAATPAAATAAQPEPAPIVEPASSDEGKYFTYAPETGAAASSDAEKTASSEE